MDRKREYPYISILPEFVRKSIFITFSGGTEIVCISFNSVHIREFIDPIKLNTLKYFIHCIVKQL